MISSNVERILTSFDELSESEKKETMLELLRRNVKYGGDEITDEELAQVADSVFLELERREAEG